MAIESSEGQFKEGLLFLKGNNLEKATKAFEKAYKGDKESAKYMSYYGMCAALRWGEIGLGIELCTTAVKKEFYRTEFYINLAKVYLKADNKKGALAVFKKGLRFDPENDTIHEEMVKLGDRKRAIIPFLRRSSPLNKFFGVLLRKTIPDILNRLWRRKEVGKEDKDVDVGI